MPTARKATRQCCCSTSSCPRSMAWRCSNRCATRADLRSIPVVMLTSSREEPDLDRAYQLGVNAYVVKPVEFKEFVGAISDLGIFWAVLNEPPPGSTRVVRRPKS